MIPYESLTNLESSGEMKIERSKKTWGRTVGERDKAVKTWIVTEHLAQDKKESGHSYSPYVPREATITDNEYME